MDSESVNLEERLKSFLIQLQNEFRILDRIVYKGKNQHRRCFYFQYVMKVRRDVKLLLSAGLQEMLDFLFQIINEKKPTRTGRSIFLKDAKPATRKSVISWVLITLDEDFLSQIRSVLINSRMAYCLPLSNNEFMKVYISASFLVCLCVCVFIKLYLHNGPTCCNVSFSLKRRKCNTEKYNYQERLLGVARLLSQMVEPMVKSVIDISSLLARSFFMGFSVTILAILGRLRVLVQQILLDVVSVHNLISSISQKEHSVKLNRQGIEVIREYYPSNDVVVHWSVYGKKISLFCLRK
ncbi:uncharacterized protein LOC113352284 [Papaver somniferum]|uniref:uncharacterized protein LOC113352284 n=1 Tax=Papaver somniferum TaxID=3469 RepID=UPI000E6FB2BE|nr:uncharacterized protein LOC113352284 [Papaver somniferum]